MMKTCAAFDETAVTKCEVPFQESLRGSVHGERNARRDFIRREACVIIGSSASYLGS